jgi:hypothetical protein
VLIQGLVARAGSIVISAVVASALVGSTIVEGSIIVVFRICMIAVAVLSELALRSLVKEIAEVAAGTVVRIIAETGLWVTSAIEPF